ncbi:dGTP triphosphohydrolase [Paenibacillus sp. FSL M7-0802]|jgi:dGTPase|uniref:DNTP triphosphohydrolase n=1 Tax=Paenibacillus polymyxa TaxID=1406 RepID=A0AAP3ZVG3_PAEPO|nr:MULTISPECIES: dNTP triphosphohydrolase [Paenibacillus]APQ58356.1 dGTP triphosphohydrolase [Paenibacillus polymyxa]MBP1175066.1 dGTPase [Paenibacillus sp. PvR133]MCP3744286.1 dNTP triphosphohydrolase [Paenibacillus sp. A3M_27_13]MDH2330281.1 dNTP triphosphohydrolase [Paenibacillus polymyxa]OMF34444.1 dGTP triphosphohydrolase [Paenibacillus peoriae]
MTWQDKREHRQFAEQTRSDASRAAYERDYSRLIHSPTFRRLQGKSQVFGAGTGDYYRTRLTHSLEVAQIAREASRSLLRRHPEVELEQADNAGLIIDPEVVECASIAHDFGHPPFGHKGEEVLDGILDQLIETKVEKISSAGGFTPESKRGQEAYARERRIYEHFEGNAHNFRLIMFLEKRENVDGLNLSDAVLLGINKYPYPGILNKKGLYLHEWEYIRSIREDWGIPDGKKTLEAQLMDLCDDIAYSAHDLEDGIKAGKIEVHEHFLYDPYLIRLITEKITTLEDSFWQGWQLAQIEQKVAAVLSEFLKVWNGKMPMCEHDYSRTRREVKAYWVSLFVSSLGVIEDGNWKKVTFVRDGSEDLDMLRTVSVLKSFAWVTMIRDLRVQRLQKRSEWMLRRLWLAFLDPETSKSIIPSDWLQRYERDQAKAKPIWTWEHMVIDYIAGMTDAFAEKIYNELYGLKVGSIYDLD